MTTNVVTGYIWPERFGQLNSIGNQKKTIEGILIINEKSMLQGSLKIEGETFDLSGNLSTNWGRMILFLTKDDQKIRLSLEKKESDPIAKSWEGILPLKEDMGISISII